MPILMKRKNGEITPYRNSEYITAYLLLPEVILERCPSALHLPRKASSYFLDWDVIEVVESDLFLLLIIDAYAYLVWPYLGVKGFMEAYSGFDPIYGVARDVLQAVVRTLPPEEGRHVGLYADPGNQCNSGEDRSLRDETAPSV